MTDKIDEKDYLEEGTGKTGNQAEEPSDDASSTPFDSVLLEIDAALEGESPKESPEESKTPGDKTNSNKPEEESVKKEKGSKAPSSTEPKNENKESSSGKSGSKQGNNGNKKQPKGQNSQQKRGNTSKKKESKVPDNSGNAKPQKNAFGGDLVIDKSALSDPYKKMILFIGIGVAIIAIVVIVVIAMGVGGNNGNGGGNDTAAVSDKQSDQRYSENREFSAPKTTEAEDGTVLRAPEGYVPAYESEKEGNEIKEHKVGEEFKVSGIVYTVYPPSNVHASNSREGSDSFLVDIDMKNPSKEGDPGAVGSGTTLFFFAPNGLYLNDLIEDAKREASMQKVMEYEQRNEPVPQEVYDEMYDHEEDGNIASGQSKLRTIELPYRGDGIYTVEVRDFINNELHRVPFEVKLDPNGQSAAGTAPQQEQKK